MKLNDYVMQGSEILNKSYKQQIGKVGIDKFIKQTKKENQKNSIMWIKGAFDGFKKDARRYKFQFKLNEEEKEMISIINKHKNNIPIFEIEDDDIKYDIKFPMIPYDNFFIASNASETIEEDIYSFSGFFVSDMGKYLQVIYEWGRTIEDGWGFSIFLIKKDSLLNNFDEGLVLKELNQFSFRNERRRDINMIACKKFDHLMKKLIYKINKKEYNSYKMHTHGIYTEKTIVFSSDVRAHKRHFWKDTGRFIIPKLTRDEILKRGYEIDELVLKDGELRRDVPFMIISEFKIGEEKKESNKVYEMIEKRIWRSEEKVYSILREIFPDKIIRRHDRRMLKGLELDFNIPELRLGIEYDGEQHYNRKICEEVFKSSFDEQVRRDRKKNKLCKKKKICLIRIKYDEPLTKRHIKKKLKDNNIIF